nr:enoyl-CoA hydratase-related protein [Myxococcota bacterium]
EISALMKQLARGGREDLSTLQRFGRSFFQIVRRNLEFSKPVVTGVSGEMTLEELGVALTCDRVLLSNDCQMRNVNIGVGLPAGPILTFLLPHIVGPKLSMTLLTDVNPLGASEALDLGLADRIVPREELEADCMTAVRQLSQLQADVVSATRELIFSQYDKFEDHVERHIRMAVHLLHSRGW